VGCDQCHPGKGAEWAGDLTRAVELEPVGIVGIETCRQCHGPATDVGAGVRHGCTDCHGYHNGANPLQGIGAAARDPKAGKQQGRKTKQSSTAK
jgi:hypothetical protein